MNFSKRMGICILASTTAWMFLAPPVRAAGEPGDGQHDLDFNIGVWNTHIKRILDPLSGSTKSIELKNRDRKKGLGRPRTIGSVYLIRP